MPGIAYYALKYAHPISAAVIHGLELMLTAGKDTLLIRVKSIHEAGYSQMTFPKNIFIAFFPPTLEMYTYKYNLIGNTCANITSVDAGHLGASLSEQ